MKVAINKLERIIKPAAPLGAAELFVEFVFEPFSRREAK